MTRLKHSVQDLEQRVAPLHHLLGPGGGGPLHSPHPRRGSLDQQTVPAVRGGVRAAVRTLPGSDKTFSRDEYQEVNQEKLPVLVKLLSTIDYDVWTKFDVWNCTAVYEVTLPPSDSQT